MKTQTSKALLVIDMQKGSFTDDTPRHDRQGVVNRINVISHIFREKGYPVIFIQHDGTSKDEFIPNSKEWELLDELFVEDTDFRINKFANDVFYQSSLSSFIPKDRIDELFIMGCATDFCVEASVQSALVKDYNVTVVKDGHTTADRPHVNAEDLIKHYNWVWSHMAPTQGQVSVLSSEEIQSAF